MAKKNQTLLVVHSLPYQGERLLGDKWTTFFADFRSQLKAKGIESPDSNSEHLVFNFNNPSIAIISFFESLENTKKKLGKEEILGTIPIQTILHLEKKGDKPPHFREASSSVWDSLHQENLYISRSLKLQWDQVMAGIDLPPYKFQSSDSGLFRIQFSDQAQIKSKKLFPYRDLPTLDRGKACFYCGMTNHLPTECPSKFLTTEIRALSGVGYQPFTELNDNYKKAFANQEKIIKIFESGIDAALVRKDPVLLAFLSYFDLCLPYQLRFLWHQAFTTKLTWDGTCKTSAFDIDSRNLLNGLDCLRVGEYAKAKELFRTENQMLRGKQFHANIGLAFVALELGRTDEMLHYLDVANNLAEKERERIYISLLLSRYHDFAGHLWKASQAIQPICSLYLDCAEAQYRKVQIVVRGGEGGKVVKFLQELSKTYRHLFMTALMDPVLLPLSGIVEDMLFNRAQYMTKIAQENLTEAEEECKKLSFWFESDDKDLQTNLNALENLKKQYTRKSYFDILDITERAKGLANSCVRLQETKLDELNEKVDDAVINWDMYNTFWKSYTYKTFFTNFENILRSSKRELVETRTVAAKSLGKATEKLESALGDIEELKPIIDKMNRLKTAMDIVGAFGKKILLTEIVLVSIIFVSFPLVTFFGVDILSDSFVKMMGDSQFQKNGLFITSLLIAPLMAFVLTLHNLAKK